MARTAVILFLLAVKLRSISTRPRPHRQDVSSDQSEYFAKLRHLQSEISNSLFYLGDLSDHEVTIRRFQEEVGLVPNGQLNPDTIALLTRPRCGNSQEMRKSSGRRDKRFVPHESKWGHTALSWTLTDPYKLLSLHDHFVMRSVLRRAFSAWAVASRNTLRFYEEMDPESPFADITVYFARGDHNDSLPFDGKNGVVAHGFYPTDGNLHFDADELWTDGTRRGINIYQTAVHEIGHLLGLEHSQDYDAVMFPINRPYDPNFHLEADDVRGVRYLYTPWSWAICHSDTYS